jgi:hypothetical protein
MTNLSDDFDKCKHPLTQNTRGIAYACLVGRRANTETQQSSPCH